MAVKMGSLIVWIWSFLIFLFCLPVLVEKIGDEPENCTQVGLHFLLSLCSDITLNTDPLYATEHFKTLGNWFKVNYVHLYLKFFFHVYAWIASNINAASLGLHIVSIMCQKFNLLLLLFIFFLSNIPKCLQIFKKNACILHVQPCFKDFLS